MSCDALDAVTHRFVQGLRLDSQLRYITVEARDAQMLAALPLSWPGTSSGDESGRLCLLRDSVVIARARARGIAAAVPALSDSSALAAWYAQSELRLTASVEPAPLTEFGLTIQGTMHSGGACGVLLLTKEEARWAFVTGLEMEGANGRVRALLLLDPARAMPWCTGYNARIELRRSSPSSQEHVHRGIEGYRNSARLQALLTVKPSGS